MPINHAKKGGFEKYPKSGLLDQTQYCASSPNKSKFVKLIDNILNNSKNITPASSNLLFIIFLVNLKNKEV